MELDNQLEAVLSRSAEQLKALSTEKQKLDQENQVLFTKLKTIENNKNNMMEAIKDTTSQMNAELERKFKIQNDIAKIKEEIVLMESKNYKQVAVNKKYEESMVKQLEDIKKQTAINEEIRSKEKEVEEAYLSSLESKKCELQRGIEEELKMIDQHQVFYIVRKN